MSSIVLNDEQVEGTIRPLAKYLRLTSKPEVLYDGPIRYTTEEITKYGLTELKKIGKNYKLIRYSEPFYFIIVNCIRFNRNAFTACEYFNHFIQDVKSVDRPKVYIMTDTSVSDSQFKQISSNLVNVPYRFVPLKRIYPLLYSPSDSLPMARTLTFDYELLGPKVKTFNHREWPLIKDSDPVSIIVNALPDELIRVKRTILDEMTPYTEFEIRQVYKTKNNVGDLADSGIDGLEGY